MKKLLIFHPYLAPYRIDCYNALANDFNLYVILLGSNKEIATLGYDLECVNQQARFKYKYYSKGFYLGRHLLSNIYYKEINKFKPDIILAHEYGVNTIAAILLNKIFNYNIYITCDDSPYMAMNYSLKRKILRKWVISHISGIVTVNQNVKDYLLKKYIKNQCKFLYFPIVQNDKLLQKKLNDSANMANQYLKEYNLYRKKIVLFVGRLEFIKCPELLINAFKHIKNNNIFLVIVGNGSLYEYLKNKIAKDDNIIMVGQKTGKELYAWYYLAQIFVLPSNFEPFGAVTNEALVSGCYTIVSDRVGASSLISKTNGLIFNNNNIQDLILSINKAIKKVNIEKKHHSLMISGFDKLYQELFIFLNSDAQ